MQLQMQPHLFKRKKLIFLQIFSGVGEIFLASMRKFFKTAVFTLGVFTYGQTLFLGGILMDIMEDNGESKICKFFLIPKLLGFPHQFTIARISFTE